MLRNVGTPVYTARAARVVADLAGPVDRRVETRRPLRRFSAAASATEGD